MAFDAGLAERVRAELGDVEGVAELTMFGGWGVTISGNMAVGVMGTDLIVRVGPAAFDAALERRGARPFDFTGRRMTGWVYVDQTALNQRRALGSWVALGLRFAQSLPPKTARTRPPARRVPRRSSSK